MCPPGYHHNGIIAALNVCVNRDATFSTNLTICFSRRRMYYLLLLVS